MNLLSPFITAASDCDGFGGTLYWTPTPATQSADCTVEFTNTTDRAIRLNNILVSGGAFILASLNSIPTILQPDDVVSVTVRGVATGLLSEGDLTLVGDRNRTLHLMLDPKVVGVSAVVRADRGCNAFTNRDLREDAFCRAWLTNNGTGPIDVGSTEVGNGTFYDEQIGAGFTMNPGINVLAPLFADNVAGAIPSSTFDVAFSNGAQALPLSANFLQPTIAVVDNDDCDATRNCNGIRARTNVPFGVTVHVRNGPVAAHLAAVNNAQVQGQTNVQIISPLPFLLEPNEERDLQLAMQATRGGSWRNTLTFVDELGPLLQLIVSGDAQ